MKAVQIVIVFLLFGSIAFAQQGKKIIQVDDRRLFKIILEVNELTILSMSNDFFRMQAIKVVSDELVTFDNDITEAKQFYYIVIANYDETPVGKLYKTANLISPQITVLPDSYKFFKIVIRHGEKQEKLLVLYASNEKIYIKKE